MQRSTYCHAKITKSYQMHQKIQRRLLNAMKFIFEKYFTFEMHIK